MTRVTTIFLLLVALPGLAQAQCTSSMSLTTPPGLPGGNGQNGAMFDIQATTGVVIQDFGQAFFAAGSSGTFEVYAITGGGSFVGNETNAAAWTLLGTSGTVSGGPGVASFLGLTLGYLIPAGTTQGFYVTSSTAGLTNIAYTNGAGTPGVTVVTSDANITVTEGVGKSYPFGATFMPRNWNGEICYDPAAGLFANFSGTPLSGPGPLGVTFTDLSMTNDPAGIQTWGWSFGDGNNSTAQNPGHVYACPGTYDVTLMVTDTLNPAATLTKTGYVTVGAPALTLTTTGVGDLTITPAPTSCYPTATSGYTLITFTPGGGPFFGIFPDAVTFLLINLPPNPDVIPHFLVTPIAYPNSGPIVYPPGFFAAFTGSTMEAVEILLNVAGTPVFVSNVASVTF